MNIEWQIKLSQTEWFFVAIIWFAYALIFSYFLAKTVFSNRFLISVIAWFFKRRQVSSKFDSFSLNDPFASEKVFPLCQRIRVIISLFFLRKERFSSKIGIFLACFLGKLMIPVFLFVLWLHPVWVFDQPEKAEMILLLDDSQSMNRPLSNNEKQLLFNEQDDSLNRSNLQNFLNKESNNPKMTFNEEFLSENKNLKTPFLQAKHLIDSILLKWPSQSRFNVKMARLSDPLSWGKNRSIIGDANNEFSPLRTSLSLLAKNQGKIPICSVILLSDGVENPNEASEISVKYPFVVNSIGLGSTAIPFDLSFQWPQDLKMSDIASDILESDKSTLFSQTKGNVFCRLNYDSLKNEATLESFLFISGLPTNALDTLPLIRLELTKISPTDDNDQLISTQNIASNELIKKKNYYIKKLLFRWNPDQNDRFFRLTASLQYGKDWNDQNNSIDFILEKERKPIQVLLIDEEPRFEYRFLRELLRREPNIQLNTLLLSANPKAVENDPIAVSKESLSSEKLAEYDVIILGDVLPDSLGLTFPRLEKLFQNELSTVAFWFIAGDRFMPGKYEKTFLNSFMSRKFSQNSEGINGNERFLIEQTDSFADVFSNLSPSDFVFEVSRIYPQEFWGDHLRILASAGNIPIFLTTYSNRHKILWQGTDELWKLHNGTQPEIYRTFVLNCLNHLNQSDFIDQEFQKESNESNSFALQEKENVRCQMPFLSELAAKSNGAFFDLSEKKYQNHSKVMDDLIRLLIQQSNSLAVIQKKSEIPSIILFVCLLILLVFLWKNEKRI